MGDALPRDRRGELLMAAHGLGDESVTALVTTTAAHACAHRVSDLDVSLCHTLRPPVLICDNDQR